MATPIVVTTTNVADDLAAACLGDGCTLVPASAVYSGNALAAGTYTNGDGAELTFGSPGSGPVPLLATGIILATGKVSDAQSKVGGSQSNTTTTDFGTVGVSGDTTTLTFSFIAVGSSISVPFIFGSDEYTEFVGTNFKDRMHVLLNGVNIALIPGTSEGIDTSTCFPANVLGGAQAGGKHQEYYCGTNQQTPRAGNAGLHCFSTIAYDGLCIVNLTATVVPGAVNTLEIQVEDVGDGSVDSAILIGISTSEAVFEVEVEGTIPLTWVERTDSSGAVHVSANVALPDPSTYYHGYKAARVLQWGTVRRGLSDDQGQYEGSEFRWVESDADRSIRAQLASTTSPTTRYFPNRPLVVRMIADEDRRALLVPRVIFRGLIRDYKPGSPLTFSFTGRDYFDALFSQSAEAQQIPQRTISADDFPQCGDSFTYGDDPSASPPVPGTTLEIGAADLPVPIIYGAITDTFVDPDDAGDGQCPAVFVGVQTLSDGDHYKWIVAGHACKSIDEVYINNDAQSIQTDADMSGIGGLWKIPGYAGWTDEFSADPFEDINGHRYTVVYGKRGPDAVITSSSVANPTHVTATAHGLTDGPSAGLTSSGQMEVTIIGHAGSTPDINGVHIVTVLDADHFSIPVDVTVGGTGGRVLQFYGPDIAAGVYPARDSQAVAFALSVQGIEDVGDGSGALITDAFEQYLHCLQNWVIGNYQSGAWLDSPSFPDDATLPMIDADSFTTTSGTAWTRLSGGYRGDFIIGATAVGPGGSRVGGERITARELVARFNQSFDVQAGFNRKTQFFISMLDEFADVSATVQISDVESVVKDSLEITDDVQRLWNVVPYRHTRDYFGRMGGSDVAQLVKGKTDTMWRSLQAGTSIQDTDSISNYSADLSEPTPFTAPTLLLHMVRARNRVTDALDYAQGTLTAVDVIAHFLARHKDPPRLVTWQTGIEGMNIDLGDIVRLTHFAGIGANGWTDRALRIVRHEADPQRLIVTLTAEDIQQILDDA